jgi:hydrogenase-4 component F
VLLYASLKYQGSGWATLNYSNLHAHYQHIAPIVRTIATIFIVCGFGTKAGLVPFHTWLPDTHSQAPSPVSGLLSGVLLGLALFTAAHVVAAVPVAPGNWISGPDLFTGFGVLSVAVGALALFVQRDIKRLLAYSSIEQVGLISVALGINSQAALFAAMLQFTLHAVIKSSLFYGAGHLTIRYQTRRLRNITGLMARYPAYAAAWAVGMLALAGLPPLGLAYSEWLILRQLWQHHAYLTITVVATALTLTFAALAYHLIRMLWQDVETAPQELVQIGGEAL